jgi:uncharacterized protein (TIGR03792 family)
MKKRLILVLMLSCLHLLAGWPSFAYAEAASLSRIYPDMVIEWLKFRVDPKLRELYLEKDADIWTPALKRYPGFIDKVTWLDPAQDSEIVFVIRWATRDQWKAIPEADLEAINQEFDAAFAYPYEMIESKEFYPQE